MFFFPDTRVMVRAIIDTSGIGYSYTWLEYGFEQRVIDTDVPAMHVVQLGGSEDGMFREDRLQVQTYGHGSTQATRAARSLHELLVGRSHSIPAPPDPDVDGGPTEWLIDSVTVESVPIELPYQSDDLNLVSAIYRLATRGL